MLSLPFTITLSLLVLLFSCVRQSDAAEHLSPHLPPPPLARSRHSEEERFEFCGEFDPGHGGTYGITLNGDATRLFVVGESSWLDILDTSDPSAIRRIAQAQFEGMPYGEDGKYGIAYDPYFQRVVAGGGAGTEIYLIDVSGDRLTLLDKGSPPEMQFPMAEFQSFLTTPPIFVKHGSAIAAAMKSGQSAVDSSSGQTVYFGEGVYLLTIDHVSHKMSVADEGIGGFSTFFHQFYDADRDILWCGGQVGAEAIVDFSHSPTEEYRYWSCSSGTWRSRVLPDTVTHDGRWLIERVASLHPPDHWFIRIRQIEAANGSYSLWNAEMPTDGATPQFLGSPINWNGDSEDPGSRVSDRPLLPCVLTHDETHLITAEVAGNEILVLDLTDKTVEPQVLFTKDMGEGEQIQSIKGYRNRFFISLKSGRVVVYEWDFVSKPLPPSSLTADPSSLDQSIALSWSAPSAGVPPPGYCVYRRNGSDSFQEVATTAETSWRDDSTVEGRTYVYMIRSFAPAYHPVESDDSAQVDATAACDIPPKKVLRLSGEATLGGIALSWAPCSEADVLGYFVYRTTGGAPFANITSSPQTQSHYLDLDVAQEGDYSYYITAVDANLEGEPSDTITLAPGSETANLLLNPGAEEQCARHWSNASTFFVPDPANRYSFDRDLFIAVTNGEKAQGQWAFWADQTSGRYDRLAQITVDETYLLAAYQDVDVSPFSDVIDLPDREIVAAWGGKVIRTTQTDSVIPSIAIEFLDTARVVIERQELSFETTCEWAPLSSCDDVPAGTRWVRFWMFASNVKASPANAAWDDLWLILRQEQSHQPLAVTVNQFISGICVSFGATIPGKSYQIEYTDDLPCQATAWKPCGPTFEGDSDTCQWLDSPEELVNPTSPPANEVKGRFYRIKEE